MVILQSSFLRKNITTPLPGSKIKMAMKTEVFEAPGIHDSCPDTIYPCLGLPSGPAQACSEQAKAMIDGARSRVYLAPEEHFDSGPPLPFIVL